jgi:hypothetical protein
MASRHFPSVSGAAAEGEAFRELRTPCFADYRSASVTAQQSEHRSGEDAKPPDAHKRGLSIVSPEPIVARVVLGPLQYCVSGTDSRDLEVRARARILGDTKMPLADHNFA